MVWLIALFIDEIKEFPDLHATVLRINSMVLKDNY
jgi:hypothetical protein